MSWIKLEKYWASKNIPKHEFTKKLKTIENKKKKNYFDINNLKLVLNWRSIEH